MQTIDLKAWNNQDFRLPLNMAAWIAAGYDLSPASKIRLQARKKAGDATVSLFLSNQPGDDAHGTIALAGNNLVFLVPVLRMTARFPVAESLVYDARLLTADGRTVTMFGGALQVLQGVTR